MKTEDNIIVLDETAGKSERGMILHHFCKTLNIKYVTNSKDLLDYFKNKKTQMKYGEKKDD